MKPQHVEAWPLTADERAALDEAQKLLGRVPEWYWKHKTVIEDVRKAQKEEEARFALEFEALIERMRKAQTRDAAEPTHTRHGPM